MRIRKAEFDKWLWSIIRKASGVSEDNESRWGIVIKDDDGWPKRHYRGTSALSCRSQQNITVGWGWIRAAMDLHFETPWEILSDYLKEKFGRQ